MSSRSGWARPREPSRTPARTASPPATPRSWRSEAASAGTDEILVLDFGGQYSQLIARRVRECGVFAELLPHHVPLEEVSRRAPKGLILSGGPASVYADGAPRLQIGRASCRERV